MIVLGLHCGHDGSAAVVKNGRLLASVAQERLDRDKKAHGISVELIDYVLAAAGVAAADVDVLALSDWNPKFVRGAVEILDRDTGAAVPLTWNEIFGDEYRIFEARFRGRALPAYNIGHHVCHAAAAYYTSGFDDALCFTMDSSGGRLQANSLLAAGAGNRLTAAAFPGAMIGLLYGQFTERIGLGGQAFKAGSLMGLAAYGTVLPVVREQLDKLAAQSFFTEEMAYWRWVDQMWEKLARQTASFPHAASDKQPAMDLAASVQAIFEAAILRCLQAVEGDGDRLCLGGGSFLNCNINTRIVKETRFKHVHLFPACGDDGGSVGAALFTAHHVFDEPRAPYAAREIAYLGADRPSQPCDLDEIATELAAGKIVGWFQGRGEVGPRALGNSSLLADPRSPTHRDYINLKIKKREWFRPFAPSVLAECSGDWFDFDGPSPFMLHTAKVKSAEIPAVTHVDGTARMQTVSRDMNPNYYDLIARFRDLTGMPMLLNTSFNGPGEPIVTRPEDALRFWKTTPIDLMVVDGQVYRR